MSEKLEVMSEEIEVNREELTESICPSNEDSGRSTETAEEFDNYWERIVKSEELGVKSVQQESQGQPQYSNGTGMAAMQLQSQAKAQSSVQEILNSYGVKDFGEFEDLRIDRPDLYLEIQSEIVASKVNSRHQADLRAMQERLYMDNVLASARQKGLNEGDFLAFANYFQMPVTERTLELYEFNRKPVKKNNQLSTVNKVAQLQKVTADSPEGDKAVNNDFENALKVSRII